MESVGQRGRMKKNGDIERGREGDEERERRRQRNRGREMKIVSWVREIH